MLAYMPVYIGPTSAIRKFRPDYRISCAPTKAATVSESFAVRMIPPARNDWCSPLSKFMLFSRCAGTEAAQLVINQKASFKPS